MNRVILLLFIFLSLGLNAQETGYTGYDWNTFPELQVSDTVKSVNGSLITLERRITEVYLNKDNIFEEISIFHRKIRVETHDAINSFNKIYVPVDNVVEVLGIKARFISPGGRVTDVPGKNIRQIENLENKGNFQTFAIEGAEAGGEIEYFYKLRKKFNPYGSVIMQGGDPRVNIDIVYAFPRELEFLIKSYNGFPDFSFSEDSITGMNYLKSHMNYIPGIQEEKYAAYNACMMRFEYTLTHNSYGGMLRIYSFSKVANNVYSNVYMTTRTEVAAVKEVLKELPLSGRSVADQVRMVENWLKSEIVITAELPATPAIDNMLKFKQTTEFGMTRLLVAFLNQLNINFEMVITCDQSEKRFDPDFNGWNYLDDFLIYFPQLDAVILPDNLSYRIGLIPSNYQGALGLFLRPLSYGEEITTLAYDIKRLPADNFRKNTDTLSIRLRVNLDQMNLDADIHRVFTGELASSFQSFWQLLNKERQGEIVSSLFNMGNQNTSIDYYLLKNYMPNDIGASPLIWDVKLTANSLIEQAGEDFLVKIGETIGEQSELYQQSVRQLPVYVGSLHSYFRKIEFEIPDGYTISNLNDLKMRVEMFHNNRVSSCFTADYELSDSRLTIYSTEYYSEMEYPLDEFEVFRKVINAAADFNKKTILLTKK